MDRESAYEIYKRNRAEKQRRKRINAIKRRCLFFLIFILIGISVYFMYNAEIFNVAEINCTGNSIISSDEIIEKSGLKLGDNLFLSSVKRAGKNIEAIPYVDTYKVWRALPDKINIRITETTPIAYVGNESSMWIVDKNGKLIERAEGYDAERGIPLITGIIVENYEVGDVLHSSRNKLLSDGLKCAEILENLGLLSKTTEINIENSNDIKLSYDNRLYMYMGAFDTFEYKMGMVKRIFDEKQITDYEHAVLNYRTDKLYVGNEDMFGEEENPEENTDINATENPQGSDEPEEPESTSETPLQ